MSLRPVLPAQPCVQQAHAPLHDVLRIGEQYAISGGLLKFTPSAMAQARILQQIKDSKEGDNKLKSKIEAIAKSWHMTADTLLKNIHRTIFKNPKDKLSGNETVQRLIDLIMGWVQSNRDKL